MLTELKEVSQDSADARRRWFTGDRLELVVWEDDDGVRAYQLRYSRFTGHGGPPGDGVFDWRRGEGLAHFLLDDGEDRAARAKAAPVLKPAAGGPLLAVAEAFRAESEALEPRLRSVVDETLRSD